MAVGLCIGFPRLVGERKAGNSNGQEFFSTTLYIAVFVNAYSVYTVETITDQPSSYPLLPHIKCKKKRKSNSS